MRLVVGVRPYPLECVDLVAEETTPAPLRSIALSKDPKPRLS